MSNPDQQPPALDAIGRLGHAPTNRKSPLFTDSTVVYGGPPGAPIGVLADEP